MLVDPWLRGCAVAGVLMLAVTAIVGLPWPLWFAWSYVVLLSAYDARRDSANRQLPERPDAVG